MRTARGWKRIFRLAAGFCLAVSMMVAAAGVAEAASVTSSWGYINNVYGKSYKGFANVGYNQWASSYFQIQTQNGLNVASGWMGAQVRTYRETTLCDGSSIEYNGAAAHSETAYGLVKCGAGNYKANGIGYVWNGNGYNSATFPTTPYLYVPANMATGTAQASPLLRTSLEQTAQPAGTLPFGHNARHETFGSAAAATTVADEPDLIEAFGDSGAKGYVLRKDLEKLPSSPSVARSVSGGTKIALYDSSGITRLGWFTLHQSVVTNGK